MDKSHPDFFKFKWLVPLSIFKEPRTPTLKQNSNRSFAESMGASNASEGILNVNKLSRRLNMDSELVALHFNRSYSLDVLLNKPLRLVD